MRLFFSDVALRLAREKKNHIGLMHLCVASGGGEIAAVIKNTQYVIRLCVFFCFPISYDKLVQISKASFYFGFWFSYCYCLYFCCCWWWCCCVFVFTLLNFLNCFGFKHRPIGPIYLNIEINLHGEEAMICLEKNETPHYRDSRRKKI